MLELRYVSRPAIVNGPHSPEYVLQYRNLLSDEAKLGIQSSAEAEIAARYQQWKDVPYVKEESDV